MSLVVQSIIRKGPRSLQSYRQLRIPPPHPGPVDQHSDVWPHHRGVPREARNRAQEVAKEHHDAVQLDAEPDQWPPQEDQRQAAEEGRRAFKLLSAREEEERLLRSDYYGQADEEEDLSELIALARRGGRGRRGDLQGERTFPIASL